MLAHVLFCIAMFGELVGHSFRVPIPLPSLKNNFTSLTYKKQVRQLSSAETHFVDNFLVPNALLTGPNMSYHTKTTMTAVRDRANGKQRKM